MAVHASSSDIRTGVVVVASSKMTVYKVRHHNGSSTLRCEDDEIPDLRTLLMQKGCPHVGNLCREPVERTTTGTESITKTLWAVS